MKKTLLSLLMIYCISITNISFAQNSDYNTISKEKTEINTNPLAGDYTINHTGDGDFTTVQEAVTKLNENGISSAVTFIIKDGTYRENLHIKNITGASETNTITFKLEEGMNYGVYIKSKTASADDYTLYLDNTQFISFKNISFLAPENKANRLVKIGNAAANITFKNCEFLGNEVSKADPEKKGALVFSDNSQCENGSSNIKFDSNKFENGSFAIVFKGLSTSQEYNKSIYIINNSFKEQFEGSVFSEYQDLAVINSNLFTSENARGNYSAIEIKDAKGDTYISYNNVVLSSTDDEGILNGISVEQLNTNEKFHIVNNMLSATSKSACRNIYLKNVNKALVAHNSLYADGNENSFCLNITSDNTANIYKNNILYSKGKGHCIVFETEAPADLISDYNVMYNTDKRFVLKSEANKSYESLNTWSTDSKLDENSKEIDPKYCSVKNLHVLNSELKFCLKLSEVINDIDDQDRPDEKTYAGADETIGETLPVQYIVYKDDTDVPERIILKDGDNVDLVQKYSTSLPILIKNTSVNPTRVSSIVAGEYVIEEKYNEIVINANSSTIIAIFPKKYSTHSSADITFTQENGATTKFTLQCKIIPPMGVDENIKNKSVNIYPNPSNGNLNIKFNSNVEASIIDLRGNTIKRYSNINSNTIKSEQLSQGIYFLKVIEDGKIYTEKIIVK